jgi:hypothetical protein
MNALDVFPHNEAIKEYANYLANREYWFYETRIVREN